MAVAAVVSVSMGVMKPVLAKLTTLMCDEYNKLKGLRKDVTFLRHELSNMDARLEIMDSADELDPLTKNWRKDIIEMSYTIEDYIDDFMHHFSEKADDKDGILRKASEYLRTFRDRRRIANQFQEIKTLVIEARERRKTYMLNQCISITTPVVVDPRLTTLYKDSASLVGIDAQKDELVSWAMDKGKQLKVMAIVGCGGLGKTTLANEVYRNVGEKFDCKSFISVSQKPEMIGLLNSMLLQLGQGTYSHACQVQDLINKLRGHLHDKRYLIIIDDLWTVPAWNTIKCVFPENGRQSRVIITTRHLDVAISCSNDKGGVYNMKSISDQDSRKLFNKRIFGSEDDDACPPQFIDVSFEILKKCSGLPLAIITVASILACQPTRLREEWEHIQDCLASQAPANSTLTDMMHILDLSYKFLPHHLKSCFLYLGTYPEDHEIEKDDLVKKWVAEGFVSGPTMRRSAWDVAESYLNELVNRSMVQVVYSDYEVTKKKSFYKLHDMVLDLILKRCRENNFVRLVHGPEVMVEMQAKVRRLSANTRADVFIGRHLSQVRSLFLFGANCMTPFSELRFLRVLFLLVPWHVQRVNLTCVNQLLLLRYLKVASMTCRGSNNVCQVVLPSQIQSMHHLETLEIKGIPMLSFPPDIVHLPCLSHLIVDRCCAQMLPDGIVTVKSLRVLRYFRLPLDSSSHNIIEGLGELTSLKELDLRCHVGAQSMAAWSSSLQKLSNMRMLRVDFFPFSCCAETLSSWVSPPFPFLEELDVAGWTFPRVPRWISGLDNLHTLMRFGVKDVSDLIWDDVGLIGMLPNLMELYLRIEGDVIPAGGIVIGCSTGFKLLREFHLQIKTTSNLAFEAGAIPNLQRIGMRLTVDPEQCNKQVAAPVGLEHLASLKVIQYLGCFRRHVAGSR